MSKKMLLRILTLFVIASALYADPHHVHDWDPKSYVQHSNSQQEDGEAVLRRIFKDYNNCFSGVILDLGCRDGRITSDLAKYFQNATIIGIERTQNMIDHAIAFNEPISHLTFKRENLENFQLPKPADLVVSIFTLNWIKDIDATFTNLYKNMASDGKLYALLSATKEGLPFHQALTNVVSRYPSDFQNFTNPQYFYNTEQLREKLTQAGFRVISIFYKYNTKTYHSEAALKNWITQWLPQFKYLPEEKREPFINDLVQEYLNLTRQSRTSHMIHWNEYVMSFEAVR